MVLKERGTVTERGRDIYCRNPFFFLSVDAQAQPSSQKALLFFIAKDFVLPRIPHNKRLSNQNSQVHSVDGRNYWSFSREIMSMNNQNNKAGFIQREYCFRRLLIVLIALFLIREGSSPRLH